MNERDYIRTIRAFLHDPEGKVFDDAELLKMLETAASTYCKDTALYRGAFSFFVDADGIGKLPDDYVEFVSAWSGEGYQIESISVSELADIYGNYISVQGGARFIYEDLDDIGKYRLCPNPFEKENVVSLVSEHPYGITPFPGYGTPVSRRGYGFSTNVRQYQFIGDAAYVRVVPIDRIQDYMALVYHAVYQAYAVDSYFQDENKARLFYSQYRLRVARTGNMLRSTPRIRSEAKFY